MRSFVDLYSEIPLAEGAQHLLDHACVASPEPVHTFRNTYELRNRLYLGHVVDLLLNDGKKESSSLAAVVKLADFAVNGLSLDQLDKQIRSEFLLKQVPFFRAKYGPVVRYLDTWIDTDTARAALPMEARHWLRTLISENLAGVYSQHRDADHAVIQVLPNIDVALCYKLETVLRHSAAAANASVLLARSHHHRDGFHLNMQDVPQRVLVDSLGSIFPTIVIGNSGALARRIANMFQFVWRVIPPATSSQLLPRDPGQFEVGIELLERGVPLVSITQSLDTSRPAQVYVRDSEGAFKQRSL
jgi:hypothetical protein